MHLVLPSWESFDLRTVFSVTPHDGLGSGTPVWRGETPRGLTAAAPRNSFDFRTTFEAARERPQSRGREAVPFSWSPPTFDALAPLTPDNIHTLRGPRQAGKTTLTKHLIRDLLRRGESRILYFSFDLQEGADAVYDVIARARQVHPDPDGTWYLFLDEVTSVGNWQRGLKVAWDQGLIRGDFVLVTGSAAHDIKTGAERLPGRRGKGSDFLHLPMSFRDFCIHVECLPLPPETTEVEGFLTPSGRRLARGIHVLGSALQRAFDAYLAVGGFPAAVRDYVESPDRRPDPNTTRMLWSVVAGDIAGSGPLTVFFWDLSGDTLQPAKQRKVYFMDPLFGEVAPLLVPGARRAPEAGRVENQVAVALFRSAAWALTQSDAVPGAVGYWRSSSDGEIDFVVPARAFGRGGRIPVEVKGDGRTAIGNARKAIARSFGSGIVTSRTVLDLDGDVPVVPAPVLLAGLSETHTRDAGPG